MSVNPTKWPWHILANFFIDTLRNREDSIFRPIENVEAIADYLGLAQSDAYYHEHFGQVLDDFVIVNTLIECGRAVRQ